MDDNLKFGQKDGFAGLPVPYSLIRLGDMLPFVIKHFFDGHVALEGILRHAQEQLIHEGPGGRVGKEKRAEMLASLIPFEKICREWELKTTLSRLEDLKVHLARQDFDMFVTTMQSDVNGIMKAARDDIGDIHMARIPNDKKGFWEQEALFGKEFEKHFSEVSKDLRDAGNCIACEMYTAAVFQLMRVAECGLKEIAKDLLQGIKTDEQITHETWNNLLTEIHKAVNALRLTPRTDVREAKLKYYGSLTLSVQGFMDLWRNPVSHLRSDCKINDAVNAFNDVRRFMLAIMAKPVP